MTTSTSPFQLYSYGVGGNVPSYTERETLPAKYSQPLGQGLEYVGDFLGLPEGGLSESVAGGATKNTDLRWYDAFKAKQALANEPTKRSVDYSFGDPNNPDLSNPVKQKDFEDYKAKQGSGDSGNGEATQKSAVDVFKEKNPYSDITPEWNPDDFMSKLDEIYNEAVNYAGKQKQFAEQSRAGNVADIEGQFGVSKGSLDTSKGQAMGTLGQSEISSRQRQEQSLDAIRKLYNEMQMGYNQRFGGASSAGEAARALAGQEQQRQSGSTRQATSDALRQIEFQKAQVEQNYGNAVADLENKKNTAINEANRNFQSAILSIDNDIKTAANEKALAKMNLLKEYKTDLFNIKQQAAAWTANLQSMKYQADLQTESARKQLQASSSAGNSALDALQNQTSLNPNTGLQFSGADLTNAALTGQISKDELQGLIGQQSRSDIPAWMQQSGAFNF